jgi:tripartite-type tricarboxylate transporter receptor subunit TctC
MIVQASTASQAPDGQRRIWLQALAAAAGGLIAPRVAAQGDFPSRTVRIVVPYSVGIGPDLVARAVGEWLAARWGQTLLIDNKPGASGIVAFSEVRRVPADGHTLFLADTATLAVNPLIHRNLPYDAQADLLPVSLLFRATFLLLTGGKSRFGSVRELAAAARADAGRVSYASLGNGHPSQMAIESFARAIDARFLHVPFKDAGALFTAVANGDVDFTAFGYNSTAGLLKSGRLRALAVAHTRRLREAPEVPTLVEAGGPPVQMRPWAALVTPAGTPPAVYAQLQRDVTAALAAPAVREKIESAGFEVTPSTPLELRQRVEADMAEYAPLVREGRVARE